MSWVILFIHKHTHPQIYTLQSYTCVNFNFHWAIFLHQQPQPTLFLYYNTTTKIFFLNFKFSIWCVYMCVNEGNFSYIYIFFWHNHHNLLLINFDFLLILVDRIEPKKKKRQEDWEKYTHTTICNEIAQQKLKRQRESHEMWV